MSGDLEDFLRRAAERRQAKAAQQQQAAPAKRPRPQYSDRARERVTSVDQADEILTAEIVSAPSPAEDAIASRVRRVEEAKEVAAQIEADVAKKAKKLSKPASTAPGLALSGNMAEDLIRMLRKPGGIQQAILLREVLDRPEHRW